MRAMRVMRAGGGGVRERIICMYVVFNLLSRHATHGTLLTPRGGARMARMARNWSGVVGVVLWVWVRAWRAWRATRVDCEPW